MSGAAGIGRLADNLGALPAEFVAGATRDIRLKTVKSARGYAGSDMTLSGHGGKLTVRARTTGSTFVVGTVYPGPPRHRAPWFWMEEGTKSRAQGSGRHPGTPARHVWSDAVSDVMPTIRADLGRLFSAAVRSR